MKKLTALLLAALLVLSLAACGQNPSDTPDDGQENTVQTDPSTETDTETPDDAETPDEVETPDDAEAPSGGAAQKPADTTQKPAVTPQKPSNSAQKPADTTQKPASTPQKPADTTQKPADTTQKPADTPVQGPADSDTLGAKLSADFQSLTGSGSSAQSIADSLTAADYIEFAAMTAAVEPGLLTGFGNTEITGFDSGVMFGPIIGSIPFVGYVFELSADTDAAAFQDTLRSNADPRWNICTEADETVVVQSGDYVLFVMCPTSMEA